MNNIDDLDFSKICIEPFEVDYVIYHGGCTDGFTSALCAYKYFNLNNNNNKPLPIFHPGKFGILPGQDEIKDKCVLICDFSYKKDLLQKLKSMVKKLLILDHHISAEKDLKELPDENKVFRMDHSGAYITWRYFFRDQPVPKGILYVEDNDIWKKAMPNTREFTAFTSSLPFTFEAYEKLLDEDYINNEVIPQGIGMVLQNNSIINKAIKYAAPKFLQIGNKYYFVTHLNSSELKSELGNRVFSEYPNINFSATYSHNDYNNSTSFSLRSLNTATDVSEIATEFNGGGHRNASGINCNFSTSTLPVHIIDNHKSYFLLNNIYTETLTINNESHNIIYMNSTHHKKQLAKYLLQTRYSLVTKELDLVNVQECVSILLNRNNVDHNLTAIKNYGKYNISIIWNYDGFNDYTWFTVYCNGDSILKEQLLEKFKGFDNFEQHDDVFIFSQKSLNKFI